MCISPGTNIPGHTEWKSRQVRESSIVIRDNFASAHVNPGTFKLEVEVFYQVNAKRIAKGSTNFTLTKELNGRLLVNGKPIPASGPQNKLIISAEDDTFITFQLWDPTHHFDNSLVNFFWFVNEVNYGQTKNATFKNKFTTLGINDVELSVIAYHSSNATSRNAAAMEQSKDKNHNEVTTSLSKIMQDSSGSSSSREKAPPSVKFGVFRLQLESKEAVTALNVSGETWLKQGELLDLSLHCDGSGPWEYCWSIKDSSYNITGNETCNDPSRLEDACVFPIIWYFRNFGAYTVFLQISNGVATTRKLVHINIYEIVRQIPVLFFVLPIVTGILALLITLGGFTFILALKKSYVSVEIADFDFVHQEEHATEKTFFERLRDSMVNAFNNSSDTVSNVSSISSRSIQPSAAGIHYGSIS